MRTACVLGCLLLAGCGGSGSSTVTAVGVVEAGSIDTDTHMRDMEEAAGNRRTSPRKGKEFLVFLRCKDGLAICHFPPDVEDLMGSVRVGRRLTVTGRSGPTPAGVSDPAGVTHLYECRVTDGR